MISFIEAFTGKRQCKQLIKYDEATLEFGLESEYIPIKLSNFKIDRHQVHDASEIAKALSDHQFLTCQNYANVKKSDPKFKTLQEEQQKVIDAITSLRITLVTYNENRTEDKQNLDNAIKNMHSLLGQVNTPNKNKQVKQPDPVLQQQAENFLRQKQQSLKLDMEKLSLQTKYELLNMASYFHSNQNYENALTIYDHILQKEPSDGLIWKYKSLVLVSCGEFEESINSMNRAIAIDPNNGDAWVGKGNALAKIEKHIEAIGAYDKAIAIDNSNFSPWLNKAQALFELKRNEEALNYFNEAIKLNLNIEGLIGKGDVLIESKKYKQAIGAYDKAIATYNKAKENNLKKELDPTYARVWSQRGIAHWKAKHYQEALDDFDASIAINENNSLVWTMKAELIASTPKSVADGLFGNDKAIAAFDKAIEIDPNNARAWVGKGDALRGNPLFSVLNDHPAAIKCYDNALAIDRKYIRAWEGKAEALLFDHKYDEAKECKDRANALKRTYMGT